MGERAAKIAEVHGQGGRATVVPGLPGVSQPGEGDGGYGRAPLGYGQRPTAGTASATGSHGGRGRVSQRAAGVLVTGAGVSTMGSRPV